MFCISMVANLVTIAWFIFRISQKSQPTCSMTQMADRYVGVALLRTMNVSLLFQPRSFFWRSTTFSSLQLTPRPSLLTVVCAVCLQTEPVAPSSASEFRQSVDAAADLLPPLRRHERHVPGAVPERPVDLQLAELLERRERMGLLQVSLQLRCSTAQHSAQPPVRPFTSEPTWKKRIVHSSRAHPRLLLGLSVVAT